MSLEGSPAPDMLLAELESEAGPLRDLVRRVDRYSGARARAVSIAEYLSQFDSALAGRVSRCSNYLIFRHFYTVDRVKLASVHTCQLHLLCPMCAIFRGAKVCRAYWERYQVLAAADSDLRPYLVTLTVRDEADLRSAWLLLKRSVQRYHDMRKEAARGRRPPVQANRALGGVWSYEVKRGSGSLLWHPHVHALWLCHVAPDADLLRAEWQALTGAWQINVKLITDFGGFLEVFKYSLKFSCMNLGDMYYAYRFLKGQRLIGSFGIFRGVEIPENDDCEYDDLPFIEMLYRYYNDKYNFQSSGQLREIIENKKNFD